MLVAVRRKRKKTHDDNARVNQIIRSDHSASQLVHEVWVAAMGSAHGTSRSAKRTMPSLLPTWHLWLLMTRWDKRTLPHRHSKSSPLCTVSRVEQPRANTAQHPTNKLPIAALTILAHHPRRRRPLFPCRMRLTNVSTRHATNKKHLTRHRRRPQATATAAANRASAESNACYRSLCSSSYWHFRVLWPVFLSFSSSNSNINICNDRFKTWQQQQQQQMQFCLATKSTLRWWTTRVLESASTPLYLAQSRRRSTKFQLFQTVLAPFISIESNSLKIDNTQ